MMHGSLKLEVIDWGKVGKNGSLFLLRFMCLLSDNDMLH